LLRPSDLPPEALDGVSIEAAPSSLDDRWVVLVKQLVRSAGSISANIEEGYGRGTAPEFIHRLRIARGEAYESRGWYRRAAKFLPIAVITARRMEAGEIIALLTASIQTLEKKSKPR